MRSTYKIARRLLGAPMRGIRSRGFGVHSPFAYTFITTVVRKRYSYYAYDQIKRIARETRTPGSFLQLIFRVAARLDVRSAALFGPIAAAAERTLRLVRSDMELHVPKPQLVVADGGMAHHSQELCQAVEACVKVGGTVVMRCDRLEYLWEHAVALLHDHGMTFTNGKIGIIVASKYLPRQEFKVWI